MSNKYDWATAPDWASWAATDDNGARWWYENEPLHFNYGWDIAERHAGKMQRVDADSEDSLERRPMTDEIKIPEGFTAWPGGECPIHGNAEVDVFFRNGRTSPTSMPASKWHWTPQNFNFGAYDIIAYRVVTP